MFMLRFETPPGSTLSATDEYLRANEAWLLAQPELKGSFEWIGSMGGGGFGGGATTGMMFVQLTPREVLPVNGRREKYIRGIQNTRFNYEE